MKQTQVKCKHSSENFKLMVSYYRHVPLDYSLVKCEMCGKQYYLDGNDKICKDSLELLIDDLRREIDILKKPKVKLITRIARFLLGQQHE